MRTLRLLAEVFVLSMLLFLTASVHVDAQPLFFVYDADTSGFPVVRAKFLAFDGMMRPLADPKPDDFQIIENGLPRPVISVTCPQQKQYPLSAVLTIDVSTSMLEAPPGEESNMELARAAAITWANTIALDRSECALTSFDEKNYLNLDFTRDRGTLQAAINALKPQGGTSFDVGFLEEPAGSLIVAKKGKNKRIIVFLSDGQAGGEEERIVEEALNNKVTIFCVTLRTPAPELLSRIAARTGGRCFSNVSSREEIERIYRIILQLAQNAEPCQISWKSGAECVANRGVTITQLNQGSAASISYIAPARSIPSLDVDIPEVMLGAVPPGTLRDTTFTITARNTPLRITKVTSSNPRITIDPSPEALAGRQLQPGESQRVTVHYAPVDSLPTFARIEFMTDPPLCSESFAYFMGGFSAARPTAREIAIVHPNGGEKMMAGEEIEVAWKGTEEGAVSLHYSTDAGATWMQIASDAAGARRRWQVPNTPSDRCLARVAQPRRADAIRTLRGGLGPIHTAGFAHDGVRVLIAGSNVGGEIWDGRHGTFLKRAFDSTSPIIAAAVDHRNGRVLTAAADRAVRIWDIDAGMPRAILVGHKQPVRAADFSRSGARAATGSDDGVVKIWNAQTGEALKTIPAHDGLVRDVAFAPDETLLATVGGDFRLKIWEVTGGMHVGTIAPPNGGAVEFTSVTFSHDGKQLLASLGDGTARIWELSSGKLLRTLTGHQGKVNAACFTDDGKRVVTGGADGTARVWDAASGAILRIIRAHDEEVASVAINGFDGRILTAGHDGTVKIWEGDTATAHDASDATWTILKPALRITASEIDFGTVTVGEARDTTIAVMLRNLDASPITITDVTLTGDDRDAFAIVNGGGAFTLPASGTRSMGLRFTPKRAGVAKARISFMGSQPGALAAAELRGNGAAQAQPAIDVTRSVTFASLSCKETFTDQVLEIRNLGGAPLVISDALFSGSPSFSAFPIFSRLTIDPGTTGKITLRFKPGDADVGEIEGTLTLQSNAANDPTLVVTLQARRERVAIDATEKEIDMGTICAGEEASATIIVKNIGTIGTGVHGTIGAPFTLDGSSWSLIQGGEIELRVRFDGAAAGGEHRATLTLIDSICGTGMSIPVWVRVDAPAVESDDVHIVASVGTTGRGSLILKNVSDRDITITSAAVPDGRFTIAQPATPFTIGAGSSMQVAITFDALDTGLVPATLELRGHPCNFSASIPFAGVGVPTGTIVEIPTLEGAPGDRVRVPLRIIEAQRSFFGLRRTFRTTIRFDATLLEPAPGTPRGTIRDGERIITITGERVDGSEELFALDMIAALGGADSTIIHIDEFIWTDAGSRIGTRDGLFKLRDICRTGSDRLITVGGQAALKESHPNPARSNAHIEFETGEVGTSRLYLVDPMGKEVMTIIEGDLPIGQHAAELDLTALPSGTYFYILQTPTERLSRRLEVRK